MSGRPEFIEGIVRTMIGCILIFRLPIAEAPTERVIWKVEVIGSYNPEALENLLYFTHRPIYSSPAPFSNRDDSPRHLCLHLCNELHPGSPHYDPKSSLPAHYVRSGIPLCIYANNPR